MLPCILCSLLCPPPPLPCATGRLSSCSRAFDNDDDSDSSSSGGGRTGIRGSSSGLDLFNNRDSSGFEESDEETVDDTTEASTTVNSGATDPGVLGTGPKTASVQEVDEGKIQGDAEDDVEEVEDAEDEVVDEVQEKEEDTQEELREQRDDETAQLDSQLESRTPPSIDAPTFRQEIEARRPDVRTSSRPAVRPASRPDVQA